MHAAYIANHLADLHQRLANVRAWTPSARRDALIEQYEAQIDEYTDAVECGAEIAEVIEESATQEVEVSAVLDRAMTAAHKAAARSSRARRVWARSWSATRRVAACSAARCGSGPSRQTAASIGWSCATGASTARCTGGCDEADARPDPARAAGELVAQALGAPFTWLDVD